LLDALPSLANGREMAAQAELVVGRRLEGAEARLRDAEDRLHLPDLVVETWPRSESAIADIDETVSGSGPNVVLAMDADNPVSCVWRGEQTAGFKRPGWDIALSAEVTIRASATHFQVSERLFASLNGETAADATHQTEIPRHLM